MSPTLPRRESDRRPEQNQHLHNRMPQTPRISKTKLLSNCLIKKATAMVKISTISDRLKDVVHTGFIVFPGTF